MLRGFGKVNYQALVGLNMVFKCTVCPKFDPINLFGFSDPNGGSVPKAPGSEPKNPPTDENEIPTLPYWDTYDTINQFYLEMGRYYKLTRIIIRDSIRYCNYVRNFSNSMQ